MARRGAYPRLDDEAIMVVLLLGGPPKFIPMAAVASSDFGVVMEQQGVALA